MFHKQEASDEILRALIISIALQRIIGGSSLHYIFFMGANTVLLQSQSGVVSSQSQWGVVSSHSYQDCGLGNRAERVSW